MMNMSLVGNQVEQSTMKQRKSTLQSVVGLNHKDGRGGDNERAAATESQGTVKLFDDPWNRPEGWRRGREGKGVDGLVA